MESKNGMYSGAQPGGFALEMSLRRSTPPRNPNPIPNPNPNPSSNLNPNQPTAEGGNYTPGFQFAAKSRSPNMVPSDDEDGNNSGDGNNSKKGSPWQRMKWTHNMVRLLIMVVFYVGDEAAVGSNNTDGNDKKKKGKWKTVSQVMMERGFNVSPQQCEDKFNDLNKRYKRVNDILGKGTACRVVEDQTLLDTMDHLSAKTKEEVRKMINSKHLFFREMCAYHNSCGHGPGMGSDRCAIPEVEVKKKCKTRTGNHPPIVSEDEEYEDDGDDNDDDNDDGDEDEDEDYEVVTKKPRREMGLLLHGLENEMAKVMEDVRKSANEKREWLKVKRGQLEEDMMAIRTQAFEMEKQRLKWLKFSAKKEMEMEKERLANERMKLENERLMLFVRKQELGLIDK